MALNDASSERRIKLALYIREKGPVSRAQIQADLPEYAEGPGTNPDTVRRMFERDKAALYEAALAIVRTEDDLYAFDQAASLGTELELTDSETNLLLAVCLSLLEDHSYAFKDELRGALAKLGGELEAPDSIACTLAQPATAVGIPRANAGKASASLRKVRTALAEHRPLAFNYVSEDGSERRREVEAVGVFLLEGHHYLAAIDRSTQARRTFRLDRMRRLNAGGAPLLGAAPEFHRGDWMVLPFQLGDYPFEAQVLFEADVAWQAEALCNSSGMLSQRNDGSIVWTVDAVSCTELARWCIQQGAGIRPLSPGPAVQAFKEGLTHAQEVAA